MVPFLYWLKKCGQETPFCFEFAVCLYFFKDNWNPFEFTIGRDINFTSLPTEKRPKILY